MRLIATVSLVISLAGGTVARPISQDSALAAAHNSSAVITNISFSEVADGVEVEVTLTKPVQPEVSVVEHPERLVLDFPGCELAHAGQRVAVNRRSVVAVRTAHFSVTPLIARVVIDLTAAPNHSENYVGNKLVIKLASAGDGPRAGSPNTAATPAPSVGVAAPGAVTEPDRPRDRSASKAADAVSALRPGAQLLSAKPPTETAYILLARARALTLEELEPLEAKARAGNTEAETTLALAYHLGTLLKMDDAEAIRLLRQAANRGFVAAEEALAIFCQSGFGVPPDKLQAIAWYTKAAQHGSIDSATNLALMYSTGDGVPKDAAKAATLFQQAAEKGDATAQLNLAALYSRGEGVPRDEAQAGVWLTKAADQGSRRAMLELARWDLSAEHGGKVDDAIAWLTKAAEQGDATAQEELGDIFIDVKLGHVDYAQAVAWYRKAADQGQREAQFGLGARYYLGQGVPQDAPEARRWLSPAADRGHPYAQFLLAKMLETGEGGPVDPAAAAKYYEKAANFGVIEAQYNLGLMLASDRGNETNLILAYKWLVLARDAAKENGLTESAATKTVDELKKTFTPAQLAQAEHEVEAWRSAHPARLSAH